MEVVEEEGEAEVAEVQVNVEEEVMEDGRDGGEGEVGDGVG